VNHRSIAGAALLSLGLSLGGAEAVAQEAGPSLGYKANEGISVQSADQNYKITLNGRLQAQYEYLSADLGSAGGATKDTSSFRVRRAYLTVKGNLVSKDLTFNITGDWKDPSLVDGWLNYKVMSELQVMGGQQVVPFARQEINSSAGLQLVERSPVVIHYRPSYDVGAKVWGKVAGGLFAYDLGAFNGLGANRRRSTPNTALAARAVVNPLGELPYGEGDLDGKSPLLVALGGSYFMNRVAFSGATAAYETNSSDYLSGFGKPMLLNGSADVVDFGLIGADLAAKWMGLYLQGEYFMGTATAKNLVNATAGAFGGAGAKRKLESSGYYAQAGYMVLPQKLEVVARYGSYDPNTNSAAKHDAKTEIAGGLNYFFAKHGFKIQLEVASLGSEALKAGSTTDYEKRNDLRTRLQAQVLY